MRTLLRLAAVLIFATTLATHALDNGLARTPPMGWNSWNKFGCAGLNEKVVRQTADLMISTGMKDAGYVYVNLDDCWQSARDAQGNILADPATFPSGIKALADYVHGKGLKLGLYTDVGTLTCAGRPGSLGHEFQDALQYAKWGVDYLKVDWCHTVPGQSAEASYTTMHLALAAATEATGRRLVFSVCEWGSNKPWLWAAPIANLWRATPDIQDCWSCKRPWGGNGLVEIIDQMNGLESFSGPGHWNDPDMLEVGNGGMTTEEYRTHLSMWALWSAPLLAGNDISNMSADTRSILLNREVIAVDQDPAGIQGHRVSRQPTGTGPLEVWSKPMADGSRTVVLLNRSRLPEPITANWTDLGYPATLKAQLRDLWAAKDLGPFTGSYTATVPSHGVVMLTLRP